MYPVHPDEIESIINIYGQHALALKLSANPDKADELSQETFIKAWLHLSNLRDGSAIKKWLRTICINEFRMMLRKEKRGETVHEESLEELESDGALLVLCCVINSEYSTRYLRQVHACKASRSAHYAVALQTHT